ncbi:MAG: polar amino acid transport system substrate-binding protein [Micromonosporaceae bacterium]
MRYSFLVAGLVVVAVAGCAPADSGTSAGASGAASAGAAGCSPSQLRTVAAGKLTIATDDPAYPPWFTDNKPQNGQGYESAVAYAVATKLGYAKDQVAWTRVTFNNAIAPGAKAFDFDINEFSVTDERRKAVDFSAPYYDVTQAVVALKTSKIAGARTLAGLKGARLGAQVGTTSYNAIKEVIAPTAGPQVYNNTDDAKKALQNGQIDGLVVDLPTAFYITSAEIQNSVIVGQVPQPSGQPEQFGLVLDKGSALTGCVSQAVTALRGDGTLSGLEKQWLNQVAGAAVLS